jgi:hypothetical protein
VVRPTLHACILERTFGTAKAAILAAAFRSFSTRASYSTVQAKVFTQLIRGDAGLGVGKAFLCRAKIVRVLLIMLNDEIPHVIRERHTSRLRGGGELRL